MFGSLSSGSDVGETGRLSGGLRTDAWDVRVIGVFGEGGKATRMEYTSGFAWVGNSRLAYEVFGEGPVDLVSSAGSFGSFDVDWEDPLAELFFRRLATFARVIRFDRRGTGGSDALPLDALPPWESFVEELIAVMEAVESSQAVVMASYDAGPMGMLFAATKPECTAGLILVNTSAKYLRSDDYPYGLSSTLLEDLAKEMSAGWGTDQHVLYQVPSRAGDERFRRWYAKKTRAIAGPGAAEAYFRSIAAADARALLSSIQAPTLILHRADYKFMPVDQGRYLAEHIDNAELVELPGSDGPLFWEHPELALDTIEKFVTGVTPQPPKSRVMATVLFTDIVESTSRLESIGDSHWRTILDMHDDTAERLITANGGRLVKTTGDGILALFDGPGRAIRFASIFMRDLEKIGVIMRCGIHTGEVELRGEDVGGMAVHLTARILSEAGTGEILVSRTVRDLVAGSNIFFVDRGVHRLKGIEGEWQLLAVGDAYVRSLTDFGSS